MNPLVNYRTIIENAMKFASDNGVKSRDGTKECYRNLKGIGVPSFYKQGRIARAYAVLKSRRYEQKSHEDQTLIS